MTTIKKVIAQLLMVSILLGLLLSIGIHFGTDIKKTFINIDFAWLLLLVPLHTIVLILNGFSFRELCIPFDYRLKWQDWMGLSFIANFVNQLLPYRPGLLIRYLYLKKKYQMPLDIYAWTTIAYLVIIVSVSALFSTLGWWLGKLFIIEPKYIFLISFIFFTTIGLGVILKKITYVERLPTSSIQNIIHNMILSFRRITHSFSALLFAIGSMLISHLLISIIFYCSFCALATPVNFYHCMFISGILYLASIVPITAANIGIAESLAGFLTQIIYQDFGIGFSAAAIFRVSQWIPTFVLGSLFSFILMKNINPWKISSISAS